MRKTPISRLCLEATGLFYHLDLALTLDHAGQAIMVVNPKAAKRFTEAIRTRTKTDAVDAAVLAEFARRMPFEPWQHPDALALASRACARRIAALNQLRTQTKSQRHAAQQTATTPDFLLADLHQSIAHFDAQIEYLRRQVLDLISAEEVLQQSFELLINTTDIAAASAIQFLGELLGLPEDMRAKQWVAMAGLDPCEYSSGSSVNKKPRLPKAGNRYLRALPSTCPRSVPRATTPTSEPTTATSSKRGGSRRSKLSAPSYVSCCTPSTPCSRTARLSTAVVSIP